jgi:arginine repressor
VPGAAPPVANLLDLTGRVALVTATADDDTLIFVAQR